MVSATARGSRNNRSSSSANNNGTKIPTVVNVLPKTGTKDLGSSFLICSTLSDRSFGKRGLICSKTTTALSINIPRAIVNPARVITFNV